MNESESETEMTSSNFDLQQEMRNLYHNPGTGYRSIESLYRKVKNDGYDVSREQVRGFLQTQDTYTKTFPKGGPGLGKKKYRRTIVGDLGQQLQLDLVHMTEDRKYSNNGYRWILTSIEALSGYAFTEPSKTKAGVNVSEAMEKKLSKFKVKVGEYPDVVQYDDGNEFKNKNVNKLLDDLSIKHFTTLVKRGGKAFFNRKAALVERLNRTLKTMMWKYFAEHNTKKWLHILDDITFNYNISINRTIKMRPADVDQENKEEVWMTLYGDENASSKPRYEIGDVVRVEKYHPGARFVKGYTFNFRDEKFVMVGVYRGDPIMYSIQDVDTGGKIKGRFYERELSLVREEWAKENKARCK